MQIHCEIIESRDDQSKIIPRWSFAYTNKDLSGTGVDGPHDVDLLSFLTFIGLVNAQSVNPDPVT